MLQAERYLDDSWKKERQSRIPHRLCAVLYLVVLVAFALPFATVSSSCGVSSTTGPRTGLQLVAGDTDVEIRQIGEGSLSGGQMTTTQVDEVVQSVRNEAERLSGIATFDLVILLVLLLLLAVGSKEGMYRSLAVYIAIGAILEAFGFLAMPLTSFALDPTVDFHVGYWIGLGASFLAAVVACWLVIIWSPKAGLACSLVLLSPIFAPAFFAFVV